MKTIGVYYKISMTNQNVNIQSKSPSDWVLLIKEKRKKLVARIASSLQI